MNHNMKRPMPVSYKFNEKDREYLVDRLLSVKSNPFIDYYEFYNDVCELVRKYSLPETFLKFCSEKITSSDAENALLYLKNCPVDIKLPKFGWENPVEDKRRLKKTFVSEGFLAILAVIFDTPGIAHMSANDGDFFHDIRPKKQMAETQSQKALKNLNFHKDFVGHYARPEHVYNITLRGDLVNETYSTFTFDSEIISALPNEIKEILNEALFHTPFDDISTKGSDMELGDLPVHPLIENGDSIKLFEGNTKGITPEAQQALSKVLEIIHDKKYYTFFERGDAMIIRNKYSLHGREVFSIKNIEALKNRWMIKSHNVNNIKPFEKYFVEGKYGVVNG